MRYYMFNGKLFALTKRTIGMASIQCPGCKAHLSVNGLVNCPLCQTYLNPPHHAAKAAPVPASIGMGPKEWLSAIGLTGIVICVGLIVYRVIVPSEDQIYSRQVSKALLACQDAILSAAKYGGAERPPYAKNYGKGAEFYFAWQNGSFTLPNGLGGQEKASASCIGNLSDTQITRLTINGQDLR